MENHFTLRNFNCAAKGVMYYVALAMVIFSHVKVTSVKLTFFAPCFSIYFTITGVNKIVRSTEDFIIILWRFVVLLRFHCI